MTLPTVKTPPKGDASQLFYLLYGKPKIGKSTWASKFPNAIFISTDPGLDEIECYRVPAEGIIKTWEEFEQYLNEILQSKQFKVLIIDTIDMAWLLCTDFICKSNHVEYINDGILGYNKGTTLVKSKFLNIILRVKAAHMGLVLISHAQEREEDSGSSNRSHWFPTLPRKAGIEIMGLVNTILFADHDELTQNRVIRLKSSSRYSAGCHGGEYLPDKWPLEDFSGFMAAYTESLKKNAEAAGKAPVAKPAPTSNGKPAVPPTVKAPAPDPRKSIKPSEPATKPFSTAAMSPATAAMPTGGVV